VAGNLNGHTGGFSTRRSQAAQQENTIMKLDRPSIDAIIGQKPCVCGDDETWHMECYSEKTQKQIDDGYTRAYAKVRRKLRQQHEKIAK
jgi:hypothetical protein